MFHEPDNAIRAAWAENAVNTFGVETYAGRTFTTTVIEQPEGDGDAYTMIQDLISDLLHLAVKHGWDAEDITRRALAMFQDELAEGVPLKPQPGDRVSHAKLGLGTVLSGKWSGPDAVNVLFDNTAGRYTYDCLAGELAKVKRRLRADRKKA